MLQDIEPRRFQNEFSSPEMGLKDHLFAFRDNGMLLREEGGEVAIPTAMDYGEWFDRMKGLGQYLFSLDQDRYFLLRDLQPEERDGWRYVDVGLIRHLAPQWKVFACSLGAQLFRWYDGNRFCARCGHPMAHSGRERALRCTDCGRIVYPPISPSVIVGVVDGDRILLTRYAKGAYRRYSLVAGYAEFGESLERTVVREVAEEVGLKVRNIRYYGSQPWPFTDSLLVGYFAELAGPDRVTLQEEELSEATWYSRDVLPPTQGSFSLTNEMIEHFRRHGKEGCLGGRP